MPRRDSNSFDLSAEAAGLVGSALLVLPIASRMPLTLRLLSRGNLRSDAGLMACLADAFR